MDVPIKPTRRSTGKMGEKKTAEGPGRPKISVKSVTSADPFRRPVRFTLVQFPSIFEIRKKVERSITPTSRRWFEQSRGAPQQKTDPLLDYCIIARIQRQTKVKKGPPSAPSGVGWRKSSSLQYCSGTGRDRQRVHV